MHAITGLPQVSISRNTLCPRRAFASPVTASVAASSLMSAPAANALSPAPVSRMTRTAASFAQRREHRFQLIEDLGIQRMQNLRTIQRDWSQSAPSPRTAASRSSPASPWHRTPDDTIEPMIKGITLVSAVVSADTFDQLNSSAQRSGFRARQRLAGHARSRLRSSSSAGQSRTRHRTTSMPFRRCSSRSLNSITSTLPCRSGCWPTIAPKRLRRCSPRLS